MLAKVLTGTTIGVDSALVEVQADDISQGLPKFDVVGLGDAAVQEARQRVRAAIKNSGSTSKKAQSRFSVSRSIRVVRA